MAASRRIGPDQPWHEALWVASAVAAVSVLLPMAAPFWAGRLVAVAVFIVSGGYAYFSGRRVRVLAAVTAGLLAPAVAEVGCIELAQGRVTGKWVAARGLGLGVYLVASALGVLAGSVASSRSRKGLANSTKPK